jgi:hypothetical protein
MQRFKEFYKYINKHKMLLITGLHGLNNGMKGSNPTHSTIKCKRILFILSCVARGLVIGKHPPPSSPVVLKGVSEFQICTLQRAQSINAFKKNFSCDVTPTFGHQVKEMSSLMTST